MQFGCFFTFPSPGMQPASEIYQRGIDMVLLAEQLGFSRAWLSEHHFSNYSYISSPFSFLSYLAAKTQRIRLGTAITPLQFHNPVLVAEHIATLDVLSQGRAELGLGKGYQQYQFDRLNAAEEMPIDKYQEAIQLIIQSLRGEPFEFPGKYFKLPETLIVPTPVQKRLPIWAVVNTTVPESVEFAVQQNLNIFTGVLEPFHNLTHIKNSYPQLFAQHQVNHIGTQRPVFVSEDESEVRAALEHIRWNARVSVSQRHNFGSIKSGVASATPFPNEPSDEEILANNVIFGSPGKCIEKIAQLKEGLGCNYFSASFWFGALPHEMAVKSMKLFASHIIPEFREPHENQ